jgi:hypothetical protein
MNIDVFILPPYTSLDLLRKSSVYTHMKNGNGDKEARNPPCL